MTSNTIWKRAGLLLALVFAGWTAADAQAYYPGGLGNANLKLWLSATNGATLFTDSAKTAPASNGSYVAGWKDLSGNQWNLLQGDGTAKCPTWDQNAGVLKFTGGQDLHRPLGSAVPVVVSATDWSVAIVFKNNAPRPVTATPTLDQRVFHMGDVASASSTSESFDIGLTFCADNNKSGKDFLSANATSSNLGVVLRYSSEAPGSSGNGNAKTVLFDPVKGVPTSGTNLTDSTYLLDACTKMNVGIFSYSNATAMTALSTGNTNPRIFWNGGGVAVGGTSTTNTAQILTSRVGGNGGSTTSIGAVRDGAPTGTTTLGSVTNVAAVAIYNKKLSATENAILSNYFNATNTPAFSLTSGDYFTQDYTANSARDCRYELVGIGQSSSTDMVTSTVNTSRGMGFGATTIGSDGSYIMMANNGKDSLAAASTSTVNGTANAVNLYLLNRVWKIQKTGFLSSAPSTVPLVFKFNEFYASSAGVVPRAAWGTKYFLVRSSSPDMTSSDSIFVYDTPGTGAAVQSITFNVPFTSLTSGYYYTIGTLSDTSLGVVTYSGAAIAVPQTLNGNVELGDGTTTSTASVSSNTTLNGNVRINNNTTLNIPTGTTVSVNGSLLMNGKIKFTGTGRLKILTTKSFKHGTGGSFDFTASTDPKPIYYDVNAHLEYAGNGGSTVIVEKEWPLPDAPDGQGNDGSPHNLKMVGNNTIQLSGARTIKTSTEIQNGTLDLAGQTLTLKGTCKKTTAGKIKGGAAGTNSKLVIDGATGTGAFELPEILDGLHTFQVTANNSGKTISLNSDLVVHNDFTLTSGSVDIDGTKNNKYQKLTLNGTCTKAAGASLQGGDHSDLEVGEVTSNSQTLLDLPAITPSGTQTVGLRNFRVSRKAGARLSSDLAVSSSVDLTNGATSTGRLDVATSTLTLETGASIVGETDDVSLSPITGTYDANLSACGKVKVKRDFNTANSSYDNLGGIGISIISPNKRLGPGTVVTRNYKWWTYGAAGASIKRSYTIAPGDVTNSLTPNTGWGASIVFKYRDGELNSKSSLSLLLWRSENANTVGGNAAWQVMTASQAGANQIALTGIDAFSEWTAADGGALPVELVSFAGSYRDASSHLSWKTATESNNHGFEIQRRIDDEMYQKVLQASRAGEDQPEWMPIGFVPGAGTSSSPRSYNYIDKLEGISSRYTQVSYRLKQIDRDGKYVTSPEVRISREAAPVTGFQLGTVYPNPAASQASTTLSLAEASNVTLTLCTVEGKVVSTIAQDQRFDAGTHSIVVPRGALISGTYFLVMQSGVNRQVRPVTFCQ